MDTLHRTLYRHYICIEDQGLRSTQLVPTSSWRKRFAMARLSFFDTTTMDISSVGTRPVRQAVGAHGQGGRADRWGWSGGWTAAGVVVDSSGRGFGQSSP